jgi:hypothetical protein
MDAGSASSPPRPAELLTPSAPATVVCDVCDRDVAYAAFARHRRRHSGAKPFACTQCGSRFARRDARDRHERKHGEAPGRACELCGRVFQRHDALQCHVARHAQRDERARSLAELQQGVARAAALTRDLESAREELTALQAHNDDLVNRLADGDAADSNRPPIAGRCRACRTANTALLGDPLACVECGALMHAFCAGYLRPVPACLFWCRPCRGKQPCPSEQRSLTVQDVEAAADEHRLLDLLLWQAKLRRTSVPADGMCLFTAVATAVPAWTAHGLRQAKAQALLERDWSHLGAVEADGLRRTAAELGGRSRRVGGRWDTVAMDHVPTVLGDVIGRPLEILQVDMVKRTLQHLRLPHDMPGEPVRLCLTGRGIARSHYDLVDPR